VPVSTDTIFATTTPAALTLSNNTWDLKSAVGSTYKLFFDIPKEAADAENLNQFEIALYKHLKDKSDNTYKHIQLNFIVPAVLIDAFSSTILGDLV